MRRAGPVGVAEEVLGAVDATTMDLLQVASILERVSGPAADFLLDTDGSSGRLEELTRKKGYFLSSLDEDRQWYQYHSVLADIVKADLARTDPDRFLLLQRRASRWYEEHHDIDAAVRHAVAAREAERAGDLILAHVVAFASRGRNATTGLWLAQLDDWSLTSIPALAMAGAH